MDLSRPAVVQTVGSVAEVLDRVSADLLAAGLVQRFEVPSMGVSVDVSQGRGREVRFYVRAAPEGVA